MTAVNDLIVWLRVQIDADEVWARQALSPSQPIDHRIVGVSEAVVAGLARRMLIEVEAKRRIVALADKTWAWGQGSAGATAGYASLVVADTIRLLALPYADREGYREEWRP